MSDDEDWVDPGDEMGLWEHQGRPLTVRWLMLALGQAGDELPHDVVVALMTAADKAGDLPIAVEYYDGSKTKTLRPMHIDVRAQAGRPTGVVITVS